LRFRRNCCFARIVQSIESELREAWPRVKALALRLLDDPRWAWHAAERFAYPPQYRRAHPDLWPGTQLMRPSAAV